VCTRVQGIHRPQQWQYLAFISIKFQLPFVTPLLQSGLAGL